MRFLDPSGWASSGSSQSSNGSNETKIKLRAPQQAYLDLFGQIEYTDYVDYTISLSLNSLSIGGGFGPGGGIAVGSSNGRSSLANIQTGLAAFGIQFNSQSAILNYGDAMEGAGWLGEATRTLGTVAGVGSFVVAGVRLYNHRTVANFLRASVDLGLVLANADPVVLAAKGVLDVTGVSGSFYKMLGSYFGTSGYTWSPNSGPNGYIQLPGQGWTPITIR